MIHDHIFERVCSDHEVNGNVEVKLRGLTSGRRELKLERLSNVESTSSPVTWKSSLLTQLSNKATQHVRH